MRDMQLNRLNKTAVAVVGVVELALITGCYAVSRSGHLIAASIMMMSAMALPFVIGSAAPALCFYRQPEYERLSGVEPSVNHGGTALDIP